MAMSTTGERIAAALRGAFVADAASMGTHWIYDPKEMAKSVPSVNEPEFKDPPTPSFYSDEEFPGHYGGGMLSPYGEQLAFFTEFCASHGVIDGKELSVEFKGWAETFGGRKDKAVTDFLENMAKPDGQWPNCGADDDQAHCYMKVVPVTCLYAGKPECREKVEEAIRVHQNNDIAVAFGLASSCILEAVLLGSSIGEALEKCVQITKEEDRPEKSAVLDAFDRAEETVKEGKPLEEVLVELSNEMMKDKPDSPFYNLVGRSCKLPGSFVAPVHQLLLATKSKRGDRYEKAIRDNILVAGDTCSRAVIVGAILAAATGGPPKSWIDKLEGKTKDKMEAAVSTILSRTGSRTDNEL